MQEQPTHSSRRKSMKTNKIVASLKDAGEDFEWYPTTREILTEVANDLQLEMGRDKSFSIMDIGAGNGNALTTIEGMLKMSEYSHLQKYAIEKSKTLINSLPKDVFVVGTDFHQQTLIDKKVDAIFCNPPYHEYEHWMYRIISEANAKYLYLVVPRRWRENDRIIKMIERRTDKKFEKSNKVESLGEFDFEDSEFRKARAKVEIVKIRLKSSDYYNSDVLTDPFDIWFEEHFKINAAATPTYYSGAKSKAEQLHSLISGQNLIDRLEKLYREDFDRLLKTYKALEELDSSLFRELGVELKQVREGLKLKIKGMKDLYWEELFSNMDAITSRLTASSREKLLEKLTNHTSVDFTAENAYAVVIWAIKNANSYFESQLKEVYFSLADKDNIRLYKSNKHMVEDGWRYERDKQHHFTLDYRLVIQKWGVFSSASYEKYDYPNGLGNSVHDFLNDICTIGKNLGFTIDTDSKNLQWSPGIKNEFLSGGEIFMTARAFKKGTVHIQVDERFMKKLNVEAGRLLGWIKSPTEAAKEMGIDPEEADQAYGSNLVLAPTNVKLLT
jgi:hypothetical protein